MVDGILSLWFALTALSTAYVAYDIFRVTPAPGVMKWAWVLVTLYTGPAGLVIYLLSCREPLPGTHERFIAPLWKQAVGSTIHCLAGDATGIIAAAAITGALRLPMKLDLIVEYVTGFMFGLLIFQALFMKEMLGGNYLRAVRRTVVPEWLSMNAVMAGMVPVMVVLMSRDMTAMEATSPRFWGVMSAATLLGAVLAYPVSRWLVAKGLKHGMGTDRALGRGGHPLERERGAVVSQAQTGQRAAVTRAAPAAPGRAHEGLGAHGEAPPGSRETAPASHEEATPLGVATMVAATVLLLAAGTWAAARYGDMNMRPQGAAAASGTTARLLLGAS
jgi:hypothetical protein